MAAILPQVRDPPGWSGRHQPGRGPAL